MNSIKTKIYLIIGIIAISFFGYGCASTNLNLLDTEPINLEKINYKSIRISNVFVERQVDGIKVSGQVKNWGTMHVSSGHVDISIVTKEGDILKEISTNYIPGNLLVNTRRHSHGSHFNVNLPFVPPEGSIVRVAFHKAPVKTYRALNCNESPATLKGKVL